MSKDIKVLIAEDDPFIGMIAKNVLRLKVLKFIYVKMEKGIFMLFRKKT